MMMMRRMRLMRSKSGLVVSSSRFSSQTTENHRMLGEKQTERTFLAIKPDGVQRGLVGNVMSRLESRGLKIVGLKVLRPTREIAEKHYEEHKEREFFERACRFLCGKLISFTCILTHTHTHTHTRIHRWSRCSNGVGRFWCNSSCS